MLASRSERDAVTGTLLLNVMHYALRPWPWIIVALASTLTYPQRSDIAKQFPYVEPSLIGHAFDLILSIGAGTGLIYLLRWFWWRVSAWSEIAAMTSSFLVAVAFFVARKNGAQIPDHVSLIATVATTTVVWVSVTFLGPQTSRETLVKFFRLVRPAGPGWKPVRAEAGVDASPDSPAQALIGWVCGCACSSTRRSSAPAACSMAGCRSSTPGSRCSW